MHSGVSHCCSVLRAFPPADEKRKSCHFWLKCCHNQQRWWQKKHGLLLRTGGDWCITDPVPQSVVTLCTQPQDMDAKGGRKSSIAVGLRQWINESNFICIAPIHTKVISWHFPHWAGLNRTLWLIDWFIYRASTFAPWARTSYRKERSLLTSQLHHTDAKVSKKQLLP